MNQVIFANRQSNQEPIPFDINFVPVSMMALGYGADESIIDHPNEDFWIHYMTPSKTVKTIEVNRETLDIQKIGREGSSSLFEQGEYAYTFEEFVLNENSDTASIQIIRTDSVPHQRNSWYVELDSSDLYNSFYNQLKALAKSSLLGIIDIKDESEVLTIKSNNPLTFKLNGITCDIAKYVTKNPYQYLQMLLTKHVQNLGYNHTDDNAELNSGLADYKAWIAGTENDDTVAIYRLRFATNRKASKTRDERVWQNVYICTKGQNNTVVELLDAYIAILNGETSNEGGGE